MERALVVATYWHRHQTGPHDDDPYIYHPMRVAELVRRRGGTPIAQAIALLHDVLEDTELSEVLLARELELAFQSDVDNDLELPVDVHDTAKIVARGVATVTRQPGEMYADYVKRVAKSSMAGRDVKLADSTDNWARSKLLNHDKASSLRKRYERNFLLLEETDAERWDRLKYAALFGSPEEPVDG